MARNKHKKSLIVVLVVMLAAMYGFLPPVQPAGAVDSITSASNTISDSDPGTMNVIHTIDFTTGTTTPNGGFLSVKFPSEFNNVLQANVTCGWGDAIFTASSSAGSNIVDCTVGAGGQTPTSTRIQVTGVQNPSSEGSYSFYIYNYNDLGVLKERVEVPVYIIRNVLMTAHVDANLLFEISGTTTAATVNGVSCSNRTWATSTDFGTLVPNASTTVCQDLKVNTNATAGYVVTVEQDSELISSSGDTINSFVDAPDNSGSSTAVYAWQPPTATLDNRSTYGHMGLTSDDSDLNSLGGGLDFYNSGNVRYAGLNNTDEMMVMHHDGPVTGEVQDSSVAHVAYTAEISVLQEAGDYETTLTYICTATF